MSQASTQVLSTQRLRKNVDFGGGMRTIPFEGVGFQRIDNMMFENNYLTIQPGVSVEKDTGETKLYGLGVFQHRTTGNYQLLYAILDGSTYKIRGYEISDGTTVTPSGGAGDVAFADSAFSFSQLGKTGYVGNTDTSKAIYSWDGAALTAVTIAAATDPDRIDDLWTHQKRLAAIDKTQGSSTFSQISGVLSAWSAGASGSAVGGTYDSMAQIATCGISAGGYSITFSEEAGKAQKIVEVSDGQGGLDILVTTEVNGWNCNVGFKDKKKITQSKDFVYGARADGLYQINPYTGQAKNLIEGAGAIEKYWALHDFTSAVVAYSPAQRMVCVECKEKGDTTNDRMILFHENFGAFYFKTNIFVTDMVLAGDQLYGIEDSSGNLLKIFDETNFSYSDDNDTFCRALVEWDGFEDPKMRKNLKRASVHASVTPDDVMTVEAYTNGFFEIPLNTQTYTGVDVLDDGGGMAPIGKYVMALGLPDTANDTDMIRRQKTSSRCATACLEIRVTTNSVFQIHSIMWEYKNKGRLFKSIDLANSLK